MSKQLGCASYQIRLDIFSHQILEVGQEAIISLEGVIEAPEVVRIHLGPHRRKGPCLGALLRLWKHKLLRYPHLPASSRGFLRCMSNTTIRGCSKIGNKDRARESPGIPKLIRVVNNNSRLIFGLEGVGFYIAKKKMDYSSMVRFSFDPRMKKMDCGMRHCLLPTRARNKRGTKERKQRVFLTV